jgi:hypothetical protein
MFEGLLACLLGLLGSTYDLRDVEGALEQMAAREDIRGVRVELSEEPAFLSTSQAPGKIRLSSAAFPTKMSFSEAQAALARELAFLKFARQRGAPAIVPRSLAPFPYKDHNRPAYGDLAWSRRKSVLADAVKMLKDQGADPMALLTLYEHEAYLRRRGEDVMSYLTGGDPIEALAAVRELLHPTSGFKRSDVSAAYRVLLIISDGHIKVLFREIELFSLIRADVIEGPLLPTLNAFMDSGAPVLRVKTRGPVLEIDGLRIVFSGEGADRAKRAKDRLGMATVIWREWVEPPKVIRPPSGSGTSPGEARSPLPPKKARPPLQRG